MNQSARSHHTLSRVGLLAPLLVILSMGAPAAAFAAPAAGGSRQAAQSFAMGIFKSTFDSVGTHTYAGAKLDTGEVRLLEVRGAGMSLAEIPLDGVAQVNLVTSLLELRISFAEFREWDGQWSRWEKGGGQDFVLHLEFKDGVLRLREGTTGHELIRDRPTLASLEATAGVER